MKIFTSLLFLTIACLSFDAKASNDADERYRFSAARWNEGLHLLAGLGANTSYFESDIANREAGIGLNIETSVAYYFLDDYAIELNTNVMFNRVRRTLIWNTLGTIGVRFRLPELLAPKNASPYMRLAAGRGPTVFIAKGQKPESYDLGGDRVQVEGDIASMAYGVFQNAKDGLTWFLELGATVNSFRKIEAIKENKDVPEVLSSQTVTDHSAMYALTLTFGVVVF